MRAHQENLDATDADVLGGTLLDQLEQGGILEIFIGPSTQADGTISLRGPDNEPLLESVEIATETRAIRPADDPNWVFQVRTGGHFTVAYTEVTGAVCPFLARYLKAGVDF